MAEKKTTTKKAAETKVAAEKKVAVKKTACKKTTCKKATLVINAENVGFKAGNVYQTLATAGTAMTVAEIAKAANITTEEVLLGMGWLLKEGKVKDAEGKMVLA